MVYWKSESTDNSLACSIDRSKFVVSLLLPPSQRLTAFSVLIRTLSRYSIDPDSVGRLEVGTETLVDKSKSTKTVLMSLFDTGTKGCSRDMEGATIVNACYGGTAALLNAVAWVKEQCLHAAANRTSNYRPYAIVVAADIAVYARGPARPTSGVGAVAMLVGPDAPIAMLPERATHASHVWDFFKPDHTVEYPVVNGAESQACYYRALDDVYMRLADQLSSHGPEGAEGNQAVFTVDAPDYYCFHAPYNKLVQKSFARLYLLDAIRRNRQRQSKQKSSSGADIIQNGMVENGHDPENGHEDLKDIDSSPLQAWVEKPLEETYTDRELDNVLKTLSSVAFREKLTDANMASKLIGNTYTASIFFGLASLIDRVGRRGELTPGKTIAMFSYGSGALASMYRMQM